MLPAHLKRYVVDQDYSRYTPIDQAVWRYIMRQLTSYLSEHAHPCYLEGLKKTGIEVDRIPEISRMSESLEKFGWRAIPVSGFIPPAAFMELQSLGYLPIASDMRTADHLMYTPAPDIVHEAAGHAPILVDHDFAAYLKAYAQVARKAIISHEDMKQYEAIRVLSDIKEDPSSEPDDVQVAERRLDEVTRSLSHVSEAALLGRMNWWTAEYGLIGTLDRPRIFGAGLLSSYGEARSCLSDRVKKIPLTIDCIEYSYDITEPQPQLFVTPNFQTLTDVLEELASRMAYRTGGREGLEKARLAETVNTVEFDSGLQISGRLKDFLLADNEPSYLQFDGPTQLCVGGSELPGHGKRSHAHGFGSPVGPVAGTSKALSESTDAELAHLGLSVGATAELKFVSGVNVRGKVTGLVRGKTTGRLLIVSFTDCTVRLGDRLLFDPSWGSFDMAVGNRAASVFGGPADRLAFGETDDFAAKVIPRKAYSPVIQYKHDLYRQVRETREKLERGDMKASPDTSDLVEQLVEKVEGDFPHDWLLRVELLEIARRLPSQAWKPRLENDLRNLADSSPELKIKIEDGIRLIGPRLA